MKLIDKYEFAKAALDKNFETFIVHVAALEVPKLAMVIHSFRASLLAALKQNKVPTKILPEYADYADVFFPDLAIKFPENTGINEHVIELVNGKQPPYELIYSLGLVKLETFKVYIKTHLKTGFIRL